MSSKDLEVAEERMVAWSIYFWLLVMLGQLENWCNRLRPWDALCPEWQDVPYYNVKRSNAFIAVLL